MKTKFLKIWFFASLVFAFISLDTLIEIQEKMCGLRKKVWKLYEPMALR